MIEMSETLDGPGSSRRACDQCRARKIRCDKEVPCSNCKAAQRKCVSNSHASTPRAARHRVLISQQYERKIDNFEARFAGIEEMLRNLTTSLNCDVTSRRGHATSTNDTNKNIAGAADRNTAHEKPLPLMTTAVAGEEKTEQIFEGNSSMTAHVAFASDFLEQAATSASLGRQLSPEILNALKTMQRIACLQRDRESVYYESKFSHRKVLPTGGLGQLPLPPTDIVLNLLREIKVAPPMTFMTSCAFVPIDEFMESCRKVFFATEEYSITIFIIVNAGLYHLFQEKAMAINSMREELLKYHYLCRDNMDTALSILPFFLPPKRETIMALLLGVTYSIEDSKFSLAWQLNSAAAAMCQTLGWHRLQITGIEQKDTRLSTFWFCYTIDKGLSLRFGRACVFQDWDISTPHHYGGDTNPSDSWQNVFDIWIHSSRIQGETYQHLYSPAALSRPPEQRIETAGLLVEELKELWKRMEGYTPGLKQENKTMGEARVADIEDQQWRTTTLDMQIKAGEVGHWGALTLIYRAIPSDPGFPSTYNIECIQAARMAFKCHHECMDLISSNLFAQAGYLHWTVLYAPFTPFIVLFCHVIETLDTDDLKRLDDFTKSLEPVKPMSQSIQKLHRLCEVLWDVAKLYIDAKTQSQQEDEDMSMVGENFDIYLSRLGLIPQQQIPESEYYAASRSEDIISAAMTDHKAQTTQLGDWFSGNNHIMGLLEDDFLLDFDPEKEPPETLYSLG